MKIKGIFTVIALFYCVVMHSQQLVCADSSFRIKYVFDSNGAVLFNNPDTAGSNIFTGRINNGIGIMKTTWGDSVIWARKITTATTGTNSVTLPDGSIICSGASIPNNYTSNIIKISSTGYVQWIKSYALSQPMTSGGTSIRNFTFANNAIYFYLGFNNLYQVIAKLDLNGNIVWSRSFWMNLPNSGSIWGAPIFVNNVIFITGTNVYNPATQESVTTITKLNDADGSITASYSYSTVPDAVIKSTYVRAIKHNIDNSFTITGNSGIALPAMIVPSGNMFNSLLDADLNPIHNYYYKNNIPLSPTLDIALNNQNQKAYLELDIFKISENYLMTFGKNDEVLRTKKFIITRNLGFFASNINIDEKQNMHFSYNYSLANKLVTEYARISNFAPNITLGCFGKDTSILTPVPFTLIKTPFVWDNNAANVLTSSNLPYTEDTAFVTKQLICKIVSYCDTIKINGPTATCVGTPVRYTIRRNNTCLKNTDWHVDTTFANITNLEGDSAITLTFKKTFNGYIHAALSDCVVKDSFLVKAVVPAMPPLINRTDSLLCPGKTLTLNANNGFTNYVWNSTVNGQQITLSNAGIYRLTATDSCGITRTDSIAVTLSDTSLTLATLPAVCLYDTAFISLPNNVSNIVWQPTANSLLRGNTIVAYPAQSTLFTVTAQRQTNCPITRQVVVTVKNCPQTFFMPNSFTPNNDGLNDKFKPTISQPLAAYQLTIYNRYGQTIFTTTDQYKAWDGTFKGTRQPMGGYIYQCSYRFNSGTPKTANGYFILLR